MRGRLAFWLVVLAGWTVLVVVFAVSSSLTYAMSYQPPRWRYTLTMAATEWYVWAAFTPIVAWLARRFRPSRRHRWRALVLATVGLPVAFFKVTFTRVLRGPIGGDDYFQITNLVGQYLIYWAIIAATHAWLFYRESQHRALETSRLEALLAETRLQMLQMQLQPHFLFNTLNTIAELVHERPDAAERMIAGLSHLLRETLHAGLVDRVPLKQELELLARYVDIQRARFGERLQVSVTVHDGAEAALVPSLLLQPLVENAIRHGIAARAGAGRIDVAAARRGGSLRITVVDDGRGLPAGAPREGLGLANSRERLRTLYGDAVASLTVDARAEGGVIVRVSIPWEMAA